jgi:hypothetical protein
VPYLGDTQLWSGAATAPVARASILNPAADRIARTAEYRLSVNLTLNGGAPVAADFTNYILTVNGQQRYGLACQVLPNLIDRILLHASDQLAIVALAAGTAGVTVVAQLVLTQLS